MKNLFLTVLCMCFCFGTISKAQTFPVTLKITDQSKGAITNKVDDNNNANIYCWLDDKLQAANPRTPSDWWYPMYNAGGVTPDGNLIKDDVAWTWQITLNVPAGEEYEWCPGAKTLGWNPINKGMFGYTGDKGDNLVFSVSSTGVVSGHTELIIPSEQTKFPITLKVIDKTKGALTNHPEADGTNVIAWVSDVLNPNADRPGYWFYGFYYDAVDFPDGKLDKNDNDWTWSGTFQAAPGTYAWNPCMKSLAWGSMNGNVGDVKWEGSDMSFTVSATGELSGDYELIVNDGVLSDLILNLDMSGKSVSTSGIHVTGSFNGWDYPGNSPQLTDDDGDGIYSVTLKVNQAGEPYQYKFVNGVEWSDAETVFGPCAYRTNRMIVVDQQTVNVPVAAFGLCGDQPLTAVKVACIGDSNTEGAGASKPYKFSWPVQLQSILGEDYYTDNLGVSGTTLQNAPADYPWTTTDQYKFNKILDPNIILIALGTNDSKTWNWDATRYKNDYINLINEFKTYPAQPEIFMVMPSKAFSAGWGIDNNVIYNQILPVIREVSQSKGVSVIDCYTPTENISNLVPDGIHPNDEGLGIIAEKIGKVLLTVKPEIIESDATPRSSGSYYGYRWYLGDNLIGNETGSSFTATQNGTYKVAVKLFTDSDDYILSEPFTLSNVSGSGKTLAVNATPTGISDQIGDAGICFFMDNGTNCIVVIGAENGKLSIYNASGILVKSIVKMQGQETLNVNDLPAGIYFSKVENANNTIVKKFVK